ncbi:MAG TPA: hypothetical protein VHP56_04285 [Solirubrobacterales bacterium]|jgi:hypothetical protein|nr:hypothetical protein [Solirubrobacterales bacterium]
MAANAPKNVFSAGPLVQGNSADGFALFTGYRLRPSDFRSAKITIENAAPTAQEIRLFEVGPSNDFPAGELTLMVFDESVPSQIYRGDLGELPPEGIDLGCFGPGERRTYRFATLLGIESPHGGQGRGAGAVYEWRAGSGSAAAGR